MKRKCQIAGLMIMTALVSGGCATTFNDVSKNLKPNNSPASIMAISDPHYYSPTLTDYGAKFTEIINNSDGKDVKNSPQIIAAFVKEVEIKQPDAVVISGDLTLNGEQASHVEMAEYLKQIEAAGIPVLVIPGNHDINSTQAYAISDTEIKKTASISPQSFAQIYGSFGYDKAISRDGSSLSYLAALTNDIWLIMIDASQYNSTTSDLGRVKDGTLSWIEDCLKEAQSRSITVLSVTHQNLLPHNPAFSELYTIENGQELTALYEKYQVNLNLSGHMHIQNIASNDSDVNNNLDDNTLYDCATGSLAVWPNLYALVELDSTKKVSYTTNSVDYGSDSHQFFYDNSYKKFYDVLGTLYLPDETKKGMAVYATMLNLDYFSDQLDAAKIEKYKQDLNYKLWQQKMPASFETMYIESMLKEEPKKMLK